MPAKPKSPKPPAEAPEVPETEVPEGTWVAYPVDGSAKPFEGPCPVCGN